MSKFPELRMRRLRQNQVLRKMLENVNLTVNDMVLPIFVKHGKNIKNEIVSMPGYYQLSLDKLDDEINEIKSLNLPAVILFGIPESKDATGKEALRDDGIIQNAVKKIKDLAPDLMVVTDLCFCEYTDHGHCGVLSHQSGKLDLDNDASLEKLAIQAISHAEVGADMIAPSGMLDGMITTLRTALDKSSYSNTPLMSYSAKYASAFYGPFRDAAEGAPQFSDRTTYQMNYANDTEALREVELDIQEGADIIMVKPAQTYLDIIYKIKQKFNTPIAAYHVSGEFAAIKAAAEKGWLDEKKVMTETLYSIKRAGADIIINYFAKDVAKILQ